MTRAIYDRPAPNTATVANEQAALTALALGCRPDQVMVLSTGVIGRRLDMEKVERGITAIASPAALPASWCRNLKGVIIGGLGRHCKVHALLVSVA